MEKSFFSEDSGEKEPGAIPDLKDTGRSEQQGDESFRTEEGRLAAIMAYIPFLCFVPLIKMKDNPEAKFHARQGVMLFLIELMAVLFLIDGVSGFVFRAVLVVSAAFAVAGIYFALQGKNYRLPVISDLADKFKL